MSDQTIQQGSSPKRSKQSEELVATDQKTLTTLRLQESDAVYLKTLKHLRRLMHKNRSRSKDSTLNIE